ncbi:bifunctional adenosylcobinamide kinase/adenosylcobinamide-phosphate guanylyltransferase [Mangrovactinospora gilvigrisea]|uniref:bifunctional adenosylcobinamide kinase/adenosylcobinamide-phosphate guanylyltransferase n=1 Tax=Mangrovactinospora gilvigrisea TaxID=1428644 RepID=UPI000B04735E
MAEERADGREAARRRRTLVLGGARSGKSETAEALLADRPDVLYVATGGEAGGDAEWAARIARHRERRPAGWGTAETLDLEALLRADDTEPLLVDSVTTWLTGVMDELGAWDDAVWADGAEAALRRRVAALAEAWGSTRRTAVAVSDEVGGGIVPATASGRRFRDELGRVNAALAAASDEVLLVVAGRPLPLPAATRRPPTHPSPTPPRTESGGGGAATATAADGARFAVGALSVLPADATRWDRAAARRGMPWAPAVGALLGVLAAVPAVLLLLAGGGPLLAAVAGVAATAALTRGLHLDGLADTADGLGSAKPAAAALRIMKASDIGPFGVVTLLLVLLGQVAALDRAFADGGWLRGAAALVASAAAARAVMLLACGPAVPAARPGGLGATVAGTVPRGVAAAAVALVGIAGAALGYADDGVLGAVRGAGATAAAALAGAALLRHTVRRFGGITGDVLGGVVEAGATASLVVWALGG